MRVKGLFVSGLVVLSALCLMVSGAVAGQLQLKGSTTVLPIVQKVADPFMKDYPDVKVSISGGGSGNGIKALIDGTTDIAMASRAMKDKEITMAEEKGVDPVEHVIALDCIIPVVHPSNSVDDLSKDQLKQIYMGKVTNWNEVGGPDKEIAVISRDTSSGTYEVWESKVMEGERVYPGAQLLASNGAVAQAVAKNEHAIGYVGYGYLNKDLKAVSVNGVEGSPETAVKKTYPIARQLYLYTSGEPAGEIKNFIDFVKGDKGQKLVVEAGYVALK